MNPEPTYDFIIEYRKGKEQSTRWLHNCTSKRRDNIIARLRIKGYDVSFGTCKSEKK